MKPDEDMDVRFFDDVIDLLARERLYRIRLREAEQKYAESCAELKEVVQDAAREVSGREAG